MHAQYSRGKGLSETICRKWISTNPWTSPAIWNGTLNKIQHILEQNISWVIYYNLDLHIVCMILHLLLHSALVLHHSFLLKLEQAIKAFQINPLPKYKNLWQAFFFSVFVEVFCLFVCFAVLFLFLAWFCFVAIALFTGNWFFHAPLLNNSSDYWTFRKHGSKVSFKEGSSDRPKDLIKTNSEDKLLPGHFHLQISSSQIYCWITSSKHKLSICHHMSNICVPQYNMTLLFCNTILLTAQE